MKNKYRPKYQLGKNKVPPLSQEEMPYHVLTNPTGYKTPVSTVLNNAKKVKEPETKSIRKRIYDGSKLAMNAEMPKGLGILRDIMLGPGASVANLLNPEEAYKGQSMLESMGSSAVDMFNAGITPNVVFRPIEKVYSKLSNLGTKALDKLTTKMFRPRFSTAVDDLGYHSLDSKTGKQVYELTDEEMFTPDYEPHFSSEQYKKFLEEDTPLSRDARRVLYNEDYHVNQLIDNMQVPIPNSWIPSRAMKVAEAENSETIGKILGKYFSSPSYQKKGGLIKAQIGLNGTPLQGVRRQGNYLWDNPIEINQPYPQVKFSDTGVQIPEEIQNDLIAEDRWSMIPGFDQFSERMNPANPIQKGRTAVGQPITRSPQTQKKEPFNPYFMLRGATTGLSWLANNKEMNRQNQYMYNQYSTLGQMEPANIEDFQPNYYSLYARFGGKVSKQMGGEQSNIPIAQKGGRAPITVTDKNDPRLRAYNDSLILYKNQILKDNFYKNNPNYIKREKSGTSNDNIPNLIQGIEKFKKNLSTKQYEYLLEKLSIDANFGSDIVFSPKQEKNFNNRYRKVNNNIYSSGDILDGAIDYYFDPKAPVSLFSDNILPQKWESYIASNNKDKTRKIDITDVPIYDRDLIKPVQPVVYQKPQPKTQERVPIVVTNPNDPRLKAYNDSLSLYNSFYKPKITNSSAYSDWILKEEDLNKEYFKNQERIIQNPNNTNKKIKPVDKQLSVSKAGPLYQKDFYKKPVQPVVYKEEPKDYPIVTRPKGQVRGTISGGEMSPDTTKSGASVFGPANSLIGYWKDGQFWPTDGAAGKVNQADLDLKNNPEELSKFLRGKGLQMKKGGFMGINPEHKGYCTPMTKSTCTPHRKALAKTLKKYHGFHKKK